MPIISGSSSGSSNEIAYAEFTADVTVNATVEASPNAVVSSGAVTYSGSKVKIEFYSGRIITGSAGVIILNLWDVNTDLGRLAVIQTPTASAMIVPCFVSRILTPSAGSHTYRVVAWRQSADGTVGAGTGGVGTPLPGYIRVVSA